MFSLFKRTRGPALPADAYGFSFSLPGGETLPLASFCGRTLLIVNTASACGFTSQYEGLEKLHRQYSDRGFTVLGVPCNDFGGQEPGSDAEIRQFCDTRFAVSFPLTSKVKITGDDAHPFYRWAAAQKKGGLIFSKPRWNFHKYLLGPDGRLRGSFSSLTKPDDPDLISEIEASLS